MSAPDFTFIQISDHHIRASDASYVLGFSTNYSFRTVLEHIAQNAAAQADFIVSTGDLVNGASAEEYASFQRMLGLKALSPAPGPQLLCGNGLQDLPIYFLPGNHDDRDLFFRSLFPGSPPTPLLNAAFTHKGIQFIVLDWGPEVKGVMHAETLAFLQESLNKGLPSILLMHHPVEPVRCRWLDEFLADGVEAFWDAVAGKPILGIFCGHVHATFETERDGIPFYTVGSTGFQFALQEQPLVCLTPPQYRIVRVQDGKLTTQVIEVPLEL
jgi:3',5'-cyclic AMP phosphodiesterase CpdA